MKDARIGKSGPMMVSIAGRLPTYEAHLTGRPAQYTDSGKLMLSANYEFQRCDGDLAVFQDLECAPEYRRHIRFWIKDVSRLDCFLGYAVHDLR